MQSNLFFTTIPANLHVSFPLLSNLLHQDLQLPPYYLKALYIFSLEDLSLLKPDQAFKEALLMTAFVHSAVASAPPFKHRPLKLPSFHSTGKHGKNST